MRWLSAVQVQAKGEGDKLVAMVPQTGLISISMANIIMHIIWYGIVHKVVDVGG